jgi:glutamyl-tRNA synthetase
MSMSHIRVRFSPAPTGALHIGSARTALYNWLFARHTGGSFALRIEDTDVARSTQEAVDQIQYVLHWLGLEWDEGPVFQSHRFDAYLAAAQRLVDDGHAYECYCTEEEVRERNEAAVREGRPPGYDGRCRNFTAEERAALRDDGRPVSIRFRTPDEGRSEFNDVIRGEVAVEWSTISDFVIVRSNGTPVFFLANAVDDADMGITHVLRGEDLIDSTHRVLALRRALGGEGQPIYAHLPLILGAGGGKLSKRHGAVSVEEYRDTGYLPSALVNYLALLGWGPEDGREVLDIDELIGEFELARVTRSAAIFDPKKLEWMNGEHIRRMSVADLTGEALPFARKMYGPRLDVRTFENAVELAQKRSTTLVQISEQSEFLFVDDDELEVDPASWEKAVATERFGELLDAAIARLGGCDWTVEAIGAELRAALEVFGLKPNKFMHVFYTAIEGRSAGLPVFDSIYLLGRERTQRRLRRARERLNSG